MVHRGNRSLTARQRRDAKKFILGNSFNDIILAEKVCRTEHHVVLVYLKEKYEMVTEDCEKFLLNLNIIRGEVLVDSRGNGTFQKVMK